jgi:4-hydroxybenzoate polyprenyltransferase
MQKIIAFLRLIRIGNLLMMAATQILAYYCLTDHIIWYDLFQPRFVYLVLATFLAAASGYIINDYLDVKIDYINKPHKVVVGNAISRRTAMFLHLAFNVLAFLLGLLVSVKLAAWIVVCAVLLWFYSVIFKKSFVLGNLLISALSAFVVLILALFDTSISIYLVWAYSFFAFTGTFIREVIKDMEDMRGDKQYKSKTLPIKLGVRYTKMLLTRITIMMLVLIFIHVFLGQSLMAFTHKYAILLYAGYMMLFVALPLLVFLYLLYRSDTKQHFATLSTFMKIIMLLGISSMMLFRL